MIELVHRGWAKPALVWSVIAVASVLVLAPAWSERAHYDLHDGTLIAYQRAYEALDGADFKALVEIAKQRGDGRLYAGMRANWGENYRIGSVPAYAELENYDADAIGYPFRTVQALSTDVDASFDETILAQYEILNIRYMILPVVPGAARTRDEDRARAAATRCTRSTRRATSKSSTCRARSPPTAPTSAARRASSATRTSRRTTCIRRLRSTAEPRPRPPFAGDPADPAAGRGDAGRTTPPLDGSYSANVRLDRPAVVLLKESFDPRWTVTVDGVPAKPVMMAPSYVGVQVTRRPARGRVPLQVVPALPAARRVRHRDAARARGVAVPEEDHRRDPPTGHRARQHSGKRLNVGADLAVEVAPDSDADRDRAGGRTPGSRRSRPSPPDCSRSASASTNSRGRERCAASTNTTTASISAR